MGGSSTLSTSQTRIEALKLQSSAYGVTIPVVGGVNRIPGNLIWYGDFYSVAHTSNTPTGGKGGGAKTQVTSYEYFVSVLMGISQGAIDVSRIWKGKEVYTLGFGPDQYRTANETYTPPPTGPMTYTLANGATLAGEVKVSFVDTDAGWDLALGSNFTRVGSTITILDLRGYRGLTLAISYQYTVGSPNLSPLAQLGLTLVNGSMSQTSPAWLNVQHPAEAPFYRGLAYVHAQNYSLGTSAAVDNHNFEVVGSGAYRYGAAVPDCNPAAFTSDLLANGRYGARMPAERLALSTWTAYCAASGLLMSPALTEQVRAGDLVDQLCRMTNSAPVWSYNRLMVVPYGDVTLSGNGVTYAPNTTPLYDITDDVWLQDSADDPLAWEIKQPSDRYNHVKIQFNDRSNYYNAAVAEAKDDADISVNGLRTMSTISAPWICDVAVARLVAQLVLQRSLNINGTGSFKLPWAYCLLEPMDLVTLTDAVLGFAKKPVRITAIGEDEDGAIEVEVEEYPLGTATATRYPSQASTGFLHNYNVDPGPVQTPVFFEAPIERTTTGLEVYAAVSGASTQWGGYRLWVSLDGTTFKDLGLRYGGARYGKLTGPIAAGAMPVSLNGGQLNTASAADAANLTTLCYVGGATPEYLAFTTATLTGAKAYTLSGLNRQAFTTNPTAGAHDVNDAFVRVDDAIAKSGSLSVSLVGQTIYFKFTSVNIYGSAEQDLSAVNAYPYTITGAQVQLPPSDVADLQVNGQSLIWTEVSDRDLAGYRVRLQYGANTNWGTASPLHAGLITASPFTLAGKPAGTITFLVKAVDTLGNESRTPAAVITNLGTTLVNNVWETWPQAPAFTGAAAGAVISGGTLLANSTTPFWASNGKTAFWGTGSAVFWATNVWADMAYTASFVTTTAGRLLLDLVTTGNTVMVEYQRGNPAPAWSPDTASTYWPASPTNLAWGAYTPVWRPWLGALDLPQNEPIALRVSIAGGTVRGQITTLTPKVDVPDLSETVTALAISASGTRVPLTKSYRSIKGVACGVRVDGNGGVAVRIGDTLSIGPLLFVLNSSGAAVNGVIDATIQGY
ncbi:MAG: phage tail protein [Leptothrix sp. (in: b-proteobacteria)]